MTAVVQPDEPAQDSLPDLVVVGDEDDIGTDIVGAVSHLLDEGRASTDRELILGGVVELLSHGSRTTAELTRGLAGVWPSAGITEMRVEEALLAGHGAKVVIRELGLEGPTMWALTDAGQLEAAMSHQWREEMYLRLTDDIRSRAREALGYDPGERQSTLWAQLLRSALVAGIAGGRNAYDGYVQSLNGMSLVTQGVDKAAMLAALDRGETRPEIGSFLRACALAALDPTDPFGLELVTNVLTGCILHAVVARHDQRPHLDALGSLSGQRAILDTPVLLALLGPVATADPTRKLIEAAVASGVEVIAAEGSLAEVASSIQHARTAAGVARYGATDLAELRNYGRLVDNGTFSMFADAVAEGRYAVWAELEQAAEGLRGDLVAAGVDCRPYGNNDDATVQRCGEALGAVLDRRGKHRGDNNVDHDANLMAMAWRARRRRRSGSGWPGAWIVTTDTCLTPAFRSIEKGRVWPLALTPAQFASLLTRCGDPPSIDELARASVTLLAQEAAEALACRYPPEIAAQLARLLNGAASATDVRIAQTLDEVLTEGADAATVSAQVLFHRERRLSAAHGTQSKIMQDTIAAARDRAADSDERVAVSQSENRRLADDLREERDARRSAERERDEARETAEQQRRRGRRLALTVGVLVLHVALAGVCALLHRPFFIIPTAAAGLFVLVRSKRWIDDAKVGIADFLLGLSLEILVAGQWLVSLH